MKLIALLLLLVGSALAQSTCGPPTPGKPHVCLTWTAAVQPPTVTGYNVYRATTAGGENYGTPLNTALITGTSFYDTTVVIGTTYFYTAVSVGSGGALSTPSQEVSAQPVPPNNPTSPATQID